MEENSDVKGPTTRRSLRLSVDCDNVSSPATPTKKKLARVAAKPILDNIKEDTPANSPKPSRRRSTARELDDEKPVTPSRRSTRIRSNTSLVLETVLQSAAESPRAKRAARRNSLAGSDSEAPSTPVKTTRRIRKDSTSSIENNEPVASKPVIEETITEEPENQTETLSPNNALDNSTLQSRKSPRLARRSKKSGEFGRDDDKIVTPKLSSTNELDNSKSDKGKKNRGKQSKTPESIKRPDGDKIPDILITPVISTMKSSKAQSDSTRDSSKRQRTKSWTTISNDILELKEINRSLNNTDGINETGDFFDKDTKLVASIEILQDFAPRNIQCEVYFEDSNSNGDTKNDIIENFNEDSNAKPSEEIDTRHLKPETLATSNSSQFFFANANPQNLSCEPMEIDETVLDMKTDDVTIEPALKEPSLNVSELKTTDSNSESSTFKMDVNTLNKSHTSKNRKSSLSKSINESTDPLASEDNIATKESHDVNTNNSLNKRKNRKSSLSKSINELIDQLASDDNIVTKKSNDEDTNTSLNESKNRKSSLSKSINEAIDKQTSENIIVLKELHDESCLNQSSKSTESSSMSNCFRFEETALEIKADDKVTIERDLKEPNLKTTNSHSDDSINNSLKKSKNRKSPLSKSINESIDQLASENNIVPKESHNDNTNISLNKSKNRKSSVSKSINETIDQLTTEDNIAPKKSHDGNTNNSLNKIKNRKSSLSKSINEAIDQKASENIIVLKELHDESCLNQSSKSTERSSMSNCFRFKETALEIKAGDKVTIARDLKEPILKTTNSHSDDSINNSLKKSKNRKSPLSKSINNSIDQLAPENNIVPEESHNDSTNISLNKSKNRKSSVSKSINETIDQLTSEDNIAPKKLYDDNTNRSLNKSKNRKLSLLQSVNESIDQLVPEDNSVRKESIDEPSLNQSSKSKINSSLSIVQELKQKENKTSSFKVSDETNFGENTDNKTFNNAKSNISFDETDSNVSISKKRKKNMSLSNSKSENENKSTLILTRIDDSTNENSMNKSLKASLNTSSIIDHHKKRNLSDIQDNTPLRNKNVKGLGLQTSTPVVGDQKDSKSKKPEVSEIEENNSSDSESVVSASASEDNSSVDQIEQSMFFNEAEDAGDDYESADSNSEENDSEEENGSEDEYVTEDEENSDNENEKSLKPINQVHVDENVSISRLDTTTDPLQDNEDDSASLCSENEEITKGYDSILDGLNKSIKKNNKRNNHSLNIDKKLVSKGNILIDQLNLTQTKNRTTVQEDKGKVNENKELRVIKAATDDRDSDLSSLDLQLLYSDSNNSDSIIDKDSQDYIPLKRSFGATNIHDKPDNSTVLNNSSKKMEITSGGDTKTMDTSAARASQKKENHNVTNSVKKNKRLSESKLETSPKVTEVKSMEKATGVFPVTTLVDKSKKRKRVSEPLDDIENKKEQHIAEKANSKKPKRNALIIEEPQPRRSKRKAIDDNDVGNNNKKPKILKENRMENFHIPRLAPAILKQLEGTSDIKSASAKKSKVVATSSFVIEETLKRQLKPSQYLEQSIHLDTDSPDKIIPKKRAPLPRVLPFVPTAVTSSQGFTTRFQISVLPKETKFTAQTSNTKNFKNDYLFGKNIKRMGTYALYKKNRNNKLSKF